MLGGTVYPGQRAARVPGAIVGQGQVALVDQHAEHLLHEQGIALSGVKDAGPERLGESRSAR